MIGRLAYIVFLGLTSVANALAQDVAASLDRLERCGGQGLKSQVSALRNGLIEKRWVKSENQKSASLPQEYLKNLADIATACEKKTATSDAIAEDLEIKRADCQQYGMGRLVPLEVETLKGTAVVNLWEVFYEWVSGTTDKGTELRVPGVTTAKLNLPPGIYLFRARKDGVASSQLRVPVVGQDKIKVQITVP